MHLGLFENINSRVPFVKLPICNYERSFVAKYLLKLIHSEMAAKICCNLLLSFDVKIFAVFSENLNFNI